MIVLAAMSGTLPLACRTGTRRCEHANACAVGEVPVYNVSVPVMGEDWWVFELSGAARAPSEVH